MGDHYKGGPQGRTRKEAGRAWGTWFGGLLGEGELELAGGAHLVAGLGASDAQPGEGVSLVRRHLPQGLHLLRAQGCRTHLGGNVTGELCGPMSLQRPLKAGGTEEELRNSPLRRTPDRTA